MISAFKYYHNCPVDKKISSFPHINNRVTLSMIKYHQSLDNNGMKSFTIFIHLLSNIKTYILVTFYSPKPTGSTTKWLKMG